MNPSFGKNRVQFRHFEWQTYETQRFITYWDKKDINIGKYALQVAELDYPKIQRVLDYRMSGKISLIVYTDLNELKQSNVGNEEAFSGTAGTTKIVENKIFVYFDGSHSNLRRQIREGIARVFLNNMLFGDNIQEIIQNAVLLNLPAWYTDGLVAYIAEDWNTELDSRLKDAVMSGKYEDFEEFSKADPVLAGHSMWHFIGGQLGQPVVSNLLYLTRINRSIESGLLYVINLTQEQLNDQWKGFYLKKYIQQQSSGNEPGLSAKDEIVPSFQRYQPVISQVKLSPDGKKLAYCTNEIGKLGVWVYDLKDKTRQRIFKQGYRNTIQATDFAYPVIAWARNGKKMSIFYEARDEPKHLEYDFSEKKEHKLHNMSGVERVLSADYAEGNTMVLTAIANGFSTLYKFSVEVGLRRLSKDIYDYKDASYAILNGKQGVVFASNRPDEPMVAGAKLDSILPNAKFDIFFIPFNQDSAIVRLSHTPDADESMPYMLDSTHISFLSTYSGVSNRFISKVDTVLWKFVKVVKFNETDSVIIHVDSSFNKEWTNKIDTSYILPVFKAMGFPYQSTTFSRSIEAQNYAAKANKSAELFFKDNLYRIRILERDTLQRGNYKYSWTEPSLDSIPKAIQEDIIIPTQEPISPLPVDTAIIAIPVDSIPAPINPSPNVEVDIDNYVFQSEFDDIKRPESDSLIEAKKKQKGINTVRRIKENQTTELVEQEDGTLVLVTSQGNMIVQEGPQLKPMLKFLPGRVISYRPKFKTNQITVQEDNSRWFDGLQPLAVGGNNFGFQPLGLACKTSVEDILEDYRIEAGIRVPITFNGIDYFLTFHDLKHRIDKSYSIYRSERTETIENQISAQQPERYKSITTLLQAEYRYPFDVYRSLRGRIQLRDDKNVPLATQLTMLESPIREVQTIALKLEYVFDNVINVRINALKGTRYKVYGEFYNRLSVSTYGDLTINPYIGGMAHFGFDYRKYIPLDRKTILCLRAAGETTFGTDKMNFVMGGVDGWVGTQYSSGVQTYNPSQFIYQGLALNMRGFKSNARNGNSYALANAELRIPIFHYLNPSGPKANFFRNFQATLFFDAGTAWQGVNPFGADNPLNNFTVNTPPVRVDLEYFKDPIIYGYGFGIRSTVLGYFCKFDYAWGIESGVVQTPIAYFSIGTDF